MLIESNELKNYIDDIFKRTGRLSFADNVLVSAILKDVKKFVERLEVSQAEKNVQHRKTEALEGLKDK